MPCHRWRIFEVYLSRDNWMFCKNLLLSKWAVTRCCPLCKVTFFDTCFLIFSNETLKKGLLYMFKRRTLETSTPMHFNMTQSWFIPWSPKNVISSELEPQVQSKNPQKLFLSLRLHSANCGSRSQVLWREERTLCS